MPIGSFYAWGRFLFAGTGFARAIVTAIIVGETAILVYRNKITIWLCKNYNCPKCGRLEWISV